MGERAIAIVRIMMEILHNIACSPRQCCRHKDGGEEGRGWREGEMDNERLLNVRPTHEAHNVDTEGITVFSTPRFCRNGLSEIITPTCLSLTSWCRSYDLRLFLFSYAVSCTCSCACIEYPSSSPSPPTPLPSPSSPAPHLPPPFIHVHDTRCNHFFSSHSFATHPPT